jgi:nucleoside-diphosphate-sugar epimerase
MDSKGIVAVTGAESAFAQAIVRELVKQGFSIAPEGAHNEAAAVIHASESTDDDPQSTLDANVKSTIELLSRLRDSTALKAFVYLSSAEAADSKTYYASSKFAAEKYVALFHNDTKIAACSVRLRSRTENPKKVVATILRCIDEGRSGVVDC